MAGLTAGEVAARNAAAEKRLAEYLKNQRSSLGLTVEDVGNVIGGDVFSAANWVQKLFTGDDSDFLKQYIDAGERSRAALERDAGLGFTIPYEVAKFAATAAATGGVGGGGLRAAGVAVPGAKLSWRALPWVRRAAAAKAAARTAAAKAAPGAGPSAAAAAAAKEAAAATAKKGLFPTFKRLGKWIKANPTKSTLAALGLVGAVRAAASAWPDDPGPGEMTPEQKAVREALVAQQAEQAAQAAQAAGGTPPGGVPVMAPEQPEQLVGNDRIIDFLINLQDKFRYRPRGPRSIVEYLAKGNPMASIPGMTHEQAAAQQRAWAEEDAAEYGRQQAEFLAMPTMLARIAQTGVPQGLISQNLGLKGQLVQSQTGRVEDRVKFQRKLTQGQDQQNRLRVQQLLAAERDKIRIARPELSEEDLTTEAALNLFGR